MNDREKFLFDLNGYLVLEDALTADEVLAANAAVDHHADRIADREPGLIRMVRGTEGHQLHGGMTFDPSQFHRFDHGRMQCGLCVAAWQLTGVEAGDGGFACIPGSHKSHYRPASEVLRLEQDWGCVRQVEAPAGSVVFFNEALVHGTLPWQPAHRERRSVLFKYSPGSLSWGSPHGECPMADPTEAERALYEPPRRTGRTELRGAAQ